MSQAQIKRRSIGLWVLVAFMALLAVGTIKNQFAINAANTKLATQARNGQAGLNRQCKLAPIGEKLYLWAATDPKSGITPAEAALVVSTATAVCPQP